MAKPAISMARYDAWRSTAGRATYLPTEVRRQELQRAERTLVCETQSLGPCVAPSVLATVCRCGRTIDIEA
jgi:hypothetical protein